MSTPFVPLQQKMLRPATISDVDFIYQLYMHPLVNPYLLYEPMDAGSFKPIYQELLRQQVKFVYCQNETAIGMCKLVPFTHRSDHIIYLGGLAIHPDANGKGHGERMIREIQELVKERQFLRIELSVDEHNDKAIRLYERCGFKQEGLLRKYTQLKSEHRFKNEILMSFLFE
jgi:putative acetyltransferase